jgi:hypothetical protein
MQWGGKYTSNARISLWPVNNVCTYAWGGGAQLGDTTLVPTTERCDFIDVLVRCSQPLGWARQHVASPFAAGVLQLRSGPPMERPPPRAAVLCQCSAALAFHFCQGDTRAAVLMRAAVCVEGMIAAHCGATINWLWFTLEWVPRLHDALRFIGQQSPRSYYWSP